MLYLDPTITNTVILSIIFYINFNKFSFSLKYFFSFRFLLFFMDGARIAADWCAGRILYYVLLYYKKVDSDG